MLTVLQEKLAEAHGLAIAAASAVDLVEARVDDRELRQELLVLRRDADETRGRCLELESRLAEEQAEEVRAHAISTREKAADLAAAWLKAGTSPISAWTFLAMGEAAEVAAWTAVSELAGHAADGGVADLAAYGITLTREDDDT
jgi:hypothetical protein